MRGQATVELALGSIVFVGTLLIGIHLAEYAQLALKVQDAEAFAIWEATGHRVQDRKLDGDTNLDPFNRTLDTTTGVGPMTKRRFEDFDGLTGTNGGNVIGRALTEGTGVDVTCIADGNLSFPATLTAAPVYRDEGGLRCSATASIKAINVPRAFLQKEDQGFFKEKITRTAPIPICGMGFPVNGNCRGVLSVLTNDWGLVGEETRECKNSCSVSEYRGMVQRLFRGGGGQGRAFAAQFAGDPGSDANEFHFSFSGVESGMIDFVGGEGQPSFITGGAGSGMVPQMVRPRCFLGKDCP
ncbi:MAG: hypothetical protein JNM17_04590 [Archangium sp.]|nr:hypothetical protein [Archangium sp.]